MQEPMRYTSQRMAVPQDAVGLEQTTWITSGLKSNELVESSKDWETWRKLVDTCVDPQPPDNRDRERLPQLIPQFTKACQ